MDKNAMWKWLILALLLIVSIWSVTPPKDKIRLGLDLRGGTSFVVKIDKESIEREIRSRSQTITESDVAEEVRNVMRGAQERSLEVIRNRVDNLGISEPVIFPGKNNRIVIQLPGIGEEKRKEAEKSIQSLAFLTFRMVHDRNEELVSDLFANNKVPDGYRIVTIGRETYYKPAGDLDELKKDPAYKEQLSRFENPAPDYEFMLEKTDADGQTVLKPYFVKRIPELTGDFLKSASVDYRGGIQPVVNLEFDGRGATKFANITGDYAPGGPKNPDPQNFRMLAIVLDDTLYSAPVIREAIYGGNAEISGNFSPQEAQFLANILRAGSLPAPVLIEEERFVSPSLGQDSINSGIRAVLYGGIAVVVFMLAYYLLCGLVADIALILNMLLLPIGMIIAAGFLGIFASDSAGRGQVQLPVLTLPGIAGILLTIGMAVDANVLIFERIREELKTGKRLVNAIAAGYDRVFVTILDANLTTLLTGIILFIFGSGPIRGFAVTLCAGIAVSMFTALVITRLLFELLASKTSIKTLKMLSIVGDTAIDFVSRRKMAAVVSVIVIAATWSLMVFKGLSDPSKIFGVDFTGGSSVTFSLENKVPIQEIRDSLDAAGVADATIQYQREMETGGDEFLVVKAGAETGDELSPVEIVKKTVADSFPNAGVSVVQEDSVGAQIGSELQRKALWSIGLALIGIIIYISWRFELGFAIGAIVALAHDVLITAGIYTAFGRQLSLPIVAALLTIVGYSVNDTIVVFDRIREDLKLIKNKSFKEICNLSINQTLSRTLLTSITTLIAVGMLLLFGGGAVNDFALALCVGVVVGTYSSVFVATPVVLLWHKDKRPDFAKK